MFYADHLATFALEHDLVSAFTLCLLPGLYCVFFTLMLLVWGMKSHSETVMPRGGRLQN